MEYEDFYDEEYDYFDSTITDLKEQLKKEVKQEIQDKIKTLEKENAELKDVKCDKCNEDRKLILTDCYGRKHEVDCVCNSKTHLEYIVETRYVAGISSISKRNSELMVWFYLSYREDKREEDSYYLGSYFINDKIIKKFEDMSQEQKDKEYQDWYFTTLEEAQKYANYLSIKED